MTPTFTPALAASCDYTLTIKYKLSTQADDQYALISTTTFLTNPSGFIVNILETDYASYADPIVYDIWWNYVITDTSLSELETEANEYAQLTMVDTCYDNAWTVVTPTSDVTFQIPADLLTSSAVSSTANSITASLSTCSKTEDLEIWNSVTNIWESYVNDGTYPWIDSVTYGGTDSTSASTIAIETDNTGNLYDSDLETVYELRWVVSDSRSQAEDATVYDYFNVIITWECHSNSITLGNSGEGIGDWAYKLDNTARAQSASYTESLTNCPTAVTMTCEVENLDLSGDDWTTASSEVTTCDLSTGFEITKDDTDSSYLPELYVNYRIKYETPDSLLSEDEGKVVYDYITVRYYYKCADLTVSLGTDLADTTYLVKTGAS